MSDQFVRFNKRQNPVGQVSRQVARMKTEIEELREDCETLEQEREKMASNQQAIFKEIERLKTENERMRSALRRYADPDMWSFYHTQEGHIRWVSKSHGPELAMETLDALKVKASDGTLRIKKEKR